MFEIIDFLIVNPIVNILFFVYNLVGDFGIAIIIFTVLVKVLMWPLVKRQLHQTKLMRKIQPELTEIRKRCNGNKQLESLQTMDLYKRNNIKPMGSIWTLLIQLPIFFALFLAIRTIATPTPDVNIRSRAYSFTADLPRIKDLAEKQDAYLEDIKNAEQNQENNNKNQQDENKDSEEKTEEQPNENSEENTEESNEDGPREIAYDFHPKLFGIVDLTAFPGFSDTSAIIVMAFAVLSAFMQYAISRVQMPKKKKKGSWKKLMADAKEGKDPDQNEINNLVSGQMSFMMPLMMLFIVIQLPGALVLYYLVTNTFTFVQYKVVLSRVDKELDDNTDRAILRELKQKTKEIQEGEVIHNKKTGTNITRITARDTKPSKKKSSKNKNKNSKNSQSDKG